LRVAADLGAKISEINFPDPKAVSMTGFRLWHRGGGRARGDLSFAQGQYGPGSRTARSWPCAVWHDYQKIVLRREAFRGAVRLLFESVDLIAVPAQAFAAPTLARWLRSAKTPR